MSDTIQLFINISNTWAQTNFKIKLPTNYSLKNLMYIH